MARRVLVAGVGNIFLGDDAFGVEVVRRLAQRPRPAGLTVRDFGIRGLDLTYALGDGWDAVIIVDAAPRGHAPGTLVVLEPDPAPPSDAPTGPADAHGLDPAKVLALARSMGEVPACIRVVGCEPAEFGTDEQPATGLSPPVAAAVDEAVKMVESLAAELL